MLKKLTICLTALMLFLSCAASANLVAHYKLDETTGASAFDSEPAGLSPVGVIDPTVLLGQPGVPKLGGTCYRFPGSGTVVLQSNGSTASDVNPSGPFTFTMWINTVYVGNSCYFSTQGTNNANTGAGWVIKEQTNSTAGIDGFRVFFDTADADAGSGSGVPTIRQTSAGINHTNKWWFVWLRYDGNSVQFGALLDNGADIDVAGITASQAWDNTAVGGAVDLSAPAVQIGTNFLNAYVDDIRFYDNSLSYAELAEIYSSITKKANKPVPASGATLVPVDQTLSWSAPSDPNVITALTKYTVYIDPNENNVLNRLASSRVSLEQSGTSYDPPVDFAYITKYYWCVDAKNTLNDANSTVAVYQGPVWNFTTIPLYTAPVISFNSVITTLPLLPTVVSATVSGNSDPLTSSVLTLMTDDAEFPAGANAILTVNTTNLAAPTASLATDKAGTYKIKLVVQDATSTVVEAIVKVVVYADSCAAKKEAPSGWAANYYDRDGNCLVDLSDFAVLAANWLNDTSMKASENLSGVTYYVPQAIFDARIEAESVDPNDPNGVSNFPITDTIGIRVNTDSSSIGGGKVLGFTAGGSFAQYTINIPAAGVYDLHLYTAASVAGTVFNFGTAGNPTLYGTVGNMPTTGWTNYHYSVFPGALTFTAAGPTTVRISWVAQARNLDWFTLVKQP